MFSNKKYMDFSDVKLKTPLLSLPHAADTTDTLAVPDSIVNCMLGFFRQEKVDYHVIEEPSLYPPDQLKADMQRYIDINESFDACDPVLLSTPFDKDALFNWSLQTFGDTIDPSYRAYLDSERRRGEDYYNNLYEYRP